MKNNQKIFAVTVLAALALVVVGSFAPAADALTTAQIDQLYNSSTNEIDTLTANNLPRLMVWLLGIIFAFGVVGIVLVHSRRGLRTIRGS